MRAFTPCLFALVLAITTAVSASAQPGPCEPDCPQTPFGPLQTPHVITLPGNCQIEVTYATRLACGIWQDLYIDSVRMVPTPPGPGCQSYLNMNSKDLLWTVTRQMAEENPMNFTKPIPGCATDWRVVKGSCWFRPTDPAQSYSSSCSSESICCLEPYEVCFDDCGDVTCFEAQSPYSVGLIECGSSYPGLGFCEPACGDWPESGSCP